MTRTEPRWAGARPACDALVEGGVASFHCALPAGHELAPPEDPEPCVAREVPGSLRLWRAWQERRDHPMVHVQVLPVTPGEKALEAAVAVVESASDELARKLTALAGRIQDREGMARAVRQVIAAFWLSARYSEESEPDWDELAGAVVGAVLVFLDGGGGPDPLDS